MDPLQKSSNRFLKGCQDILRVRRCVELVVHGLLVLLLLLMLLLFGEWWGCGCGDDDLFTRRGHEDLWIQQVDIALKGAGHKSLDTATILVADVILQLPSTSISVFLILVYCVIAGQTCRMLKRYRNDTVLIRNAVDPPGLVDLDQDGAAIDLRTGDRLEGHDIGILGFENHLILIASFPPEIKRLM